MLLKGSSWPVLSRELANSHEHDAKGAYSDTVKLPEDSEGDSLLRNTILCS